MNAEIPCHSFWQFLVNCEERCTVHNLESSTRHLCLWFNFDASSGCLEKRTVTLYANDEGC